MLRRLLLWLLLTAAAGCPAPRLHSPQDEQVRLEEAHLVAVSSAELPPVIELLSAASVGFLNGFADRPLWICFPTLTALSEGGTSIGFEVRDGRVVCREPLAPGAVVAIHLSRSGRFPYEVRGAGTKPLTGEIVVTAPSEEAE